MMMMIFPSKVQPKQLQLVTTQTLRVQMLQAKEEEGNRLVKNM
jgi:hypothetical protein